MEGCALLPSELHRETAGEIVRDGKDGAAFSRDGDPARKDEGERMMTEEEVERMVQRLMQCLDCIYNSTDCEGEDDRNGDCKKFKSLEELS